MDNEVQFLIYSTAQEDVKIDVVVKDETIWLTQKSMAELFGVGVPAISKHLANIYEEGELSSDATISKMETSSIGRLPPHKKIRRFLQPRRDHLRRLSSNSQRATNFRIWATKILKEYMRKGFVLDDDRLKQGQTLFGKDYFRELLERVRSIRRKRETNLATDNGYFCGVQYRL